MSQAGRDELFRRIGRLSWKRRLQLVGRLATDRRTPWLARLTVLAVIGYLVLPFDIIPDFIPILGQLDDVAVIAVGGWLLLRVIPRPLMEEHLASLEPPVASP